MALFGSRAESGCLYVLADLRLWNDANGRFAAFGGIRQAELCGMIGERNPFRSRVPESPGACLPVEPASPVPCRAGALAEAGRIRMMYLI